MEGIEFQSLGNLRWLASESFVRSIGDLFGIICWVNLWLNWMEICSYPVGNDFAQERARANLEKLKGFNQPSYREDWNKYLVTVCERWCWLRLGLDIDMTIHVCLAIPTPKSHTHSSRERYLTIPVSHNHRMTSCTRVRVRAHKGVDAEAILSGEWAALGRFEAKGWQSDRKSTLYLPEGTRVPGSRKEEKMRKKTWKAWSKGATSATSPVHIVGSLTSKHV